MPTQTLNVKDPLQVFSPQMLETFIGNPQTKLLIFTGIAVPRWDSQGNSDPETVIVKLGKTLTEKPADDKYTATVALASIYNSDSDFTFATNDVSIDIDENNELQLIVEIDVQGNQSILNSFSYQLTLLVEEKQAELQLLLVNDEQGVGIPNTQLTTEPGLRWRVRVVLNRPALAPGVFVQLKSNNSIVQVPQEFIPINAGQRESQDFIAPPIRNTPGQVDVTITATLNSVDRTASITVIPFR